MLIKALIKNLLFYNKRKSDSGGESIIFCLKIQFFCIYQNAYLNVSNHKSQYIFGAF